MHLPCWQTSLTKPVGHLIGVFLLSWATVCANWFIENAYSYELSALGQLPRIAQQKYGASAAQRVEAWVRLQQTLQGQDPQALLDSVNTYVNRQLRFDDDINIWRQTDFWATPLEALGKGAGDCEDFTITKYITLRNLGIKDSQLRLIYVRAVIGNPGDGITQSHMVLGYYPDSQAEPFILDNLISEIRPASRRPDLIPLFSFNAEGLWVTGVTQPQADSTARLSRWRGVFTRMKEELQQ